MSATAMAAAPSEGATLIASAWVSQRTCLAVLGLTPPAYLARVKAWGLRVVRDGKLVLTRRSDWDAEFEKRAAGGPKLTGEDAVLAKLGLARRQ